MRAAAVSIKSGGPTQGVNVGRLPYGSVFVQRSCACKESDSPEDTCPECRRKAGTLRRKGSFPSPALAPPIVHHVLRTPGHPLERATRADIEPRLGHDLSGVRLHTDSAAAESARAVQAHAYTVGNHVVFAEGRYAPHSTEGVRLLVHELTHVVQQGGPATSPPELRVGRASDPAEAEAERAADRIIRGAAPARLSTWPVGVRRDVADAGVPEVGRGSQVACVKRLGGCANTRAGGVPSPEEIKSYNNECRRETGYSGTDVTPSDEECRGEADTRTPIERMSTADKLLEGMRRSLPKLGGELGKRLQELLSPESIAIMLAFATAYIISQTTPIGWVADILIAAMIAATVLMLGPEVVEIVKELMKFLDKSVGAKSDADFDEAGQHFATAVTKAGVDIVVAILLHRAGKAANLKPTAPRSPGLIEVLKTNGQKVITQMGEMAPMADVVTPDGQTAKVPLASVPETALAMKSEGKGGGAAVDPKDPTFKDKWLSEKEPARKQPKSVEKALAENRPWSSVEVFEALKSRLTDMRRRLGIKRIDKPHWVDPSKPPVEGGTLAAVKTDVTSLRGRFFEGASPEAVPESAKGKPGTTATKLEPTNPLAQNHAEAVALENLAGELNKLDPADLEGKHVWLLVEQEPCSSCASGIGSEATPGPIKQFSIAFGQLIVEVHSLRTSRSYFLRGGKSSP